MVGGSVLFIHCLLFLPLFVRFSVWPLLFCCAVLFCNHLAGEKRAACMVDAPVFVVVPIFVV